MQLPKQYTYITVKKDENKTIYRVKELTSDCAAEVWVHEFSKETNYTWRVMKTYPKAGRKNIFRKDYRCQHLTDRRAVGAGPSKNTDCPAKFEVYVRRYVKNTRAKYVDKLVKEYPGMIVLKHKHNHPIDSAGTPHHIEMTPETEKEPGTSPETRKKLDMSSETEEELDTSPETEEGPDTSPETVEELDMSPETEEELDMSPETEEELDMSPETQEDLDMSAETQEKLDMSPETQEKLDMSPETDDEPDMLPETKEKLSALFGQGHSPSSAYYLLNIDLLMNSAENYHKFAADTRYLPTLPTITKLFQKEFAAAESALASAIDTFGKFSGVNAETLREAKRLIQHSSSTVTKIQHTAPTHRKLLCSGRKKINVDQPTKKKGPPKQLSCHNYTSFGVSPKRKQKTPHNLDQSLCRL